LGTLGAPAVLSAVELSPDDKKVAVSLGELGQNNSGGIWIVDALRGLRTRLTFDRDVEPAWSPGGQKIAFSRGHRDIDVTSADGTGKAEPLLVDDPNKATPSWSPDGKFLLYSNKGGVMVVPMTPPGKPYQFLQLPAPMAKFSPDGRWVLYHSTELGASEIYVVPFPGPGSKRQISNGGGSYPRWGRDDKEIFYVGPDSGLMAAEINTKDNSIQVGQVHSIPITIFTGYGYMYDVSADGKRFLVPMPMDQGSIHITLVQNWTQALNK
jgi:Tol biopolymer transport system component